MVDLQLQLGIINDSVKAYMTTQTLQEGWLELMDFLKVKCSPTEFQNWLSLIQLIEIREQKLILEVPNVFVQEYFLENYKSDLMTFLPMYKGKLPLEFVIMDRSRDQSIEFVAEDIPIADTVTDNLRHLSYTFEKFIEGPSNQFAKSAAIGAATRPGASYTPLFIHGGVGRGKTHLLWAIRNYLASSPEKYNIHYSTTESFINDLVTSLRNKSLDKLKQYYRSLDIFLVDDIQFLQNRPNFEEEFCNMFESLIHEKKQIVITSDKPPSALQLSERLIARMEWGLVAHIGSPDLETRVAILQAKAEQRGIKLPHSVAFFIAERIFHNVRQLEGAINRLSAYCNLMHLEVTQSVAETTLNEIFQYTTKRSLTVDHILKSVAAMFNVKVSDLCGNNRTRNITLPRQIAMYLAKELISESSLIKLATAFGGKTHSTLLHAWKKIRNEIKHNVILRKQIQLTKQTLDN